MKSSVCKTTLHRSSSRTYPLCIVHPSTLYRVLPIHISTYSFFLLREVSGATSHARPILNRPRVSCAGRAGAICSPPLESFDNLDLCACVLIEQCLCFKCVSCCDSCSSQRAITVHTVCTPHPQYLSQRIYLVRFTRYRPDERMACYSSASV